MMKTNLYVAAIALVCVSSLCSCNGTLEDTPQAVAVTKATSESFDVVGFDRLNESSQFGYHADNGAWLQCYDESADNNLVYGKLRFSHEGHGGSIPYWSGFCPSNSDKANIPSMSQYFDYQWNNVAGTGFVTGRPTVTSTRPGEPFMVAFWNVMEKIENHRVPEDPALSISTIDGSYFKPENIYITNNSYAYLGMRYGSPYSKKFGKDDYCNVLVYGCVNGRIITGPVKIPLFDGKEYLCEWKPFSLASLGEVDALYFSMESSDIGGLGMNNPAYFCIGMMTMWTSKN